jgi:ribosomal-protein-alanine N-acetyltransferase
MSTATHLTELRTASIRDLPIVSGIMDEAFDPRFGEGWTPSQCLGMLAMPGVWMTLARLDGVDAGFALSRATLDEAELLLIATRPALRGRGVGRALLRGVIADARDRGVVNLHLEVRAGNGAIRLYAGEGFIQVGERREYYRSKDGKLYDAQTFTRKLG